MRQRKPTREESTTGGSGSTTAPLVGREPTLAAIDAALARAARVLVIGPSGSGKSAVARELVRVRRADGRAALLVRARSGDTADVLAAKVRRGMPRTRGALVVIDEAREPSPSALLAALTDLATAGHELVVTIDAPGAGTSGPAPCEVVTLEGLSATDARTLWNSLEERFGPTPQGRCDAAITATRGVPRALRRAYGLAAHAAPLGALERRVLAAAEALGLPVPPAALAALAGVDDDAPSSGQRATDAASTEAAITGAIASLLRRQLFELHDDGTIAIAPDLRARKASGGSSGTRGTSGARRSAGAAATTRLELAAAAAWADARGPFAWTDPVTARREELEHLLSAGDVTAARARLEGSIGLFVAEGASTEADVLRRRLPAVKGGDVRLLVALGRIADALAASLDGARPSGADPASLAALLLRGGDPRAARAAEAATAADAAPRRASVAGGGGGPGAPGDPGSLLAIELALHEAGPGAALAAAGPRALAHHGAFGAALALELGDVALARRIALASARGPAGEGATLVLARIALAEGRHDEAQALLAGLRDALAAAPGLVTPWALVSGEVALARGALRDAEATARTLVADARGAGDELTALAGDELLSRTLAARGRIADARRVADAAEASASARALGWLAARAALARVEADAAVGAGAAALARAHRLTEDPRLGGLDQARARAAEARLSAALGEAAADAAPALQALAAAARGEATEAARLWRAALCDALERGDRAAAAAAAAAVARLALARGDRAGAEAHAERALADGAAVGEDRAVTSALLVQAALGDARPGSGGGGAAAVSLVEARLTDAIAIARAAGLHVELAVALAATATLGEPGTSDAEGRRARRLAAEAALSDADGVLVERWLTELGFGAGRAATLVAADGAACSVSDLGALAVDLEARSLVIDGVRELVVRRGQVVADLRKRTLLKRLLYVFAGAPRTSFTKEELVRRVWRVHYHPLRHDAALFTNVMRLRRLLGPEGAQLLVAGESGYTWTPPADALFLRDHQS